MTVRTVAVVTTGRADAGHLAPVVAALAAAPALDVRLVACCAHLDARRGGTLADLDVPDGVAVDVLGTAPASSEPAALAATFAELVPLLVGWAEAHRPAVMVVLGDRWELLAVVGAALLGQVPIAHLHGGEVTVGAIDDRVRHAVTKLADLHLCATEEARRRILQMGEEPWRVVRVGAPGLDRLRGVEPLGPEDLEAVLGRPVARPLGLVTYHPPTVDRGAVRARTEAVLRSARRALGTAVVTAPGADPGADEVLAAIEAEVAGSGSMAFVPSLGASYAPLMASADVMVGNSSSGIIEAASFALPVVDVGDRQAGRTAPRNVVRCGEAEDDVDRALAAALAPSFRPSLRAMENPYGDGRAAPRIVDALASVDLDRLARKPFVDLDPS